MATQRISNERKVRVLAGMDRWAIPTVADTDKVFVFGPHPDDGTYALGARDGDSWVVHSYVEEDDPRLRIVLALTKISNALKAGIASSEEDGPYPEDW